MSSLSTLNSDQINLIIHDLANLRLAADIELIPKHPSFNGKLYPLGRCKEIRDKVFLFLQESLLKSEEPGLSLIRKQLEQGASLKKVWGSLRDEYFQNAMVLGDWYIDVSNDTVNPNKPRVEILPLNEADFSSISSFEQFVKIARPYWEVEVYRNDIFPAIAPFLPLIYINKRGISRLGYASHETLSLAIKSEFTASQSILSSLPSPPEDVKQKWQKLLENLPHNEFLHPQGDPIQFCKQYQSKQLYLDNSFCNSALDAYFKLPKGVSAK